jgi:hypothetical protein
LLRDSVPELAERLLKTCLALDALDFRVQLILQSLGGLIIRLIPDNLPREDVVYELPEDERRCPIDPALLLWAMPTFEL